MVPLVSTDSRERPPRIALSIAGHDPGGGAGFTADQLTFAAHHIYGYSAITAQTVQSTLGVARTEIVSAAFMRQVLAELQADQPPHGIKIGMLGNAPIVEEVAAFVKAFIQQECSIPHIPIVLDPVLVSSSGTALLDTVGLIALRDHLLGRVDWITPNWAELAILAGVAVDSERDALRAMACLAEQYPKLSIVATGGDQEEPCDLLRLLDGSVHRFTGQKIMTSSTHGTGCAFSSALLCRLMQGLPPREAVGAAKHYVTEAIRHAPGIGRGNGPLNLLWPLRDTGRPDLR